MNPKENYPSSPTARRLHVAQPAAQSPAHPTAQEPRLPGVAGELPHLYGQNLYGLGMAQAMELARASFASAVCINSCAMNFYKHVLWYPMGLSPWCEGGSKAMAYWTDWAGQWFGLLGQPRPAESYTYERTPTADRVREEDADEIEDGLDAVLPDFEDEILA